jgi:hypothetical protein
VLACVRNGKQRDTASTIETRMQNLHARLFSATNEQPLFPAFLAALFPLCFGPA